MERTTRAELRRQLSRLLADVRGEIAAGRSRPEGTEGVRSERRNRLETVHVPALRQVGFGLVTLAAVLLHNLLAEAPVDSASTPWVFGLAFYPVVAWLWILYFGPFTGIDVGKILPALDLLVAGLAIWLTGAETSWLFFLPLLRVAEEVPVGLRPTLAFAHAAPLTYLAMTVAREWHDGVDLLWREEAAKLALLYVGGLYLSLAALIVQGRRRGVSAALRMAQELIEDLERESRRLVLSREELKDQVMRDPLTGLLNRKGIMDIVERGLERARTGEVPFSVVLADLDSFKEINDTYGHAVGDVVLRWVAARMLASGRAFDAVGRIGGDEFLIALPNCNRSGASKLAERIRRTVAKDMVAAELEGPLKVEVSVGVATAGSAGDVSVEELIAAADAALYRAKQKGGNKVELAGIRRRRAR